MSGDLREVVQRANDALFEVLPMMDDPKHVIECHADTLPDTYLRLATGAKEAVEILAAAVVEMVESPTSEEDPEQEHRRHLAAMRAALVFFEEWAEGQSYGCFPGGDPRRFTPDPAESTEVQREAHRAACASWDRGERVEFEGSTNLSEIRYTRKDGRRVVVPPGTAFVSSSVFGHGTIQWRDEELVRARDGLRAALGVVPQ